MAGRKKLESADHDETASEKRTGGDAWKLTETEEDEIDAIALRDAASIHTAVKKALESA